uniref:cGMP-dependent protein kinase, isozyme 1 n=1 Tax=Schistocephalus solidus TaxID=70667 RepID=A0A0X3PBC4_SCHSO
MGAANSTIPDSNEPEGRTIRTNTDTSEKADTGVPASDASTGNNNHEVLIPEEQTNQNQAPPTSGNAGVPAVPPRRFKTHNGSSQSLRPARDNKDSPPGSPLTNKHPHYLQNGLMESPVTPRNDLVDFKVAMLEKDRRIDQLTSEIKKLAAVLQQHMSECEIWKKNPPVIAGRLANSMTKTLQRQSSKGSSGSDQTSVVTPGLELSPSLPVMSMAAVNKRLGVSGEPTTEPTTPLVMKYYDKDAKSRQEIRNALRNNEYLKNLDAVQLQEIVSCMYEYSIKEGCYIILEGEDGNHLYVAAEGEYEVWAGGKYLYTMGPGNCFGELALLYNCKRTASIKAVRAARLWVLERNVFQHIMMKTGIEKMEERVKFLSSVPLLKNLDEAKLQRITDVLEAQFHPAGECIIRQDEQADSFFIIQSGEVKVTMKVTGADGNQNEIEIRRMTRGEYFGEKALLGEGRRTANIYAISPSGVDLLCLYRKDFLELIGNIEDLHHREYVDLEHLEARSGLQKPEDSTVMLTENSAYALKTLQQASVDQQLERRQQEELRKEKTPSSKKLYLREYQICENLRITDLERVAVIGQGGFGRVELVKPTNDSSIGFALKRMKKVHIVETKQQEHVHSEKRILMCVDSPFICKLFKTFKDNKFVYMLMEFCPGGELWTVLRDRRVFDDKLTRFSLACVIEAFDYLHHNSIIYRDLKPENMLLTVNGYIKLCDFGFAKRLGGQRKTWTFCGTPEYVAPEVILNKGHDLAADYWSLGILTCELLMGTPPFQASEPIKIYMKALRGIEAYDLAHHKNISAKAHQLIKRLCRLNPTERLGMGRLGIQEIRNQKYFQGFDWEGVRNRSSPSPFHPKVSGPLDFSNFDQFPITDDLPPDETSGWDKDF